VDGPHLPHSGRRTDLRLVVPRYRFDTAGEGAAVLKAPGVTTLPAKAGSFSGNAFPNGIRYRLIAPSEREDVSCSIHVPVAHVSERCARLSFFWDSR
jgi:hypothetical protein